MARIEGNRFHPGLTVYRIAKNRIEKGEITSISPVVDTNGKTLYFSYGTTFKEYRFSDGFGSMDEINVYEKYLFASLEEILEKVRTDYVQLNAQGGQPGQTQKTG